jgi:hypothetical protein
VTSDPPNLPRCPGSPTVLPGDPAKFGAIAPCGNWDPMTNTDPPGCDWMILPSQPR